MSQSNAIPYHSLPAAPCALNETHLPFAVFGLQHASKLALERIDRHGPALFTLCRPGKVLTDDANKRFALFLATLGVCLLANEEGVFFDRAEQRDHEERWDPRTNASRVDKSQTQM